VNAWKLLAEPPYGGEIVEPGGVSLRINVPPRNEAAIRHDVAPLRGSQEGRTNVGFSRIGLRGVHTPRFMMTPRTRLENVGSPNVAVAI
jgi:hypothetical protein